VGIVVFVTVGVRKRDDTDLSESADDLVVYKTTGDDDVLLVLVTVHVESEEDVIVVLKLVIMVTGSVEPVRPVKSVPV
jgi:hypothetical protein